MPPMSNATTSTKYRPAATSAFERYSTPSECGCCGRENLKTTVKMAAPDGSIVWMGTGCAAKAMGVGVKEYKAAAKSVEDAAEAVRKAARCAFLRAQAIRWTAYCAANGGPGDQWAQEARLGMAGRRAFQTIERARADHPSE